MDDLELPEPPSGFSRATGVVEGRRGCLNCGSTYPVTTNGESSCPNCRSTASQSITQTGPSCPPDAAD